METGVLYEFGKFRLDPEEHLLQCDGKAVPLSPKAFEILQILLESNGRLLSKEDLMKRVWPDSFVEEANLTVTISALRKALGVSSEADDYIQTVPKRGYRFIAAVTELPKIRVTLNPLGKPSARTSTAHPSASNEIPQPQSRKAFVAFLVVMGLAVLLGGVLYLRNRHRPTANAPESSRRLAILPLQNLKGDSDSEFLGYSLADAVIMKLGYVKALRVRPSYAIEKYRDKVIDIRKAAEELNVDTILTGNFIRDGDDLRITCELVEVPSQNILWRDAFDVKYDKLITVHDRVAQEIVKGLELNLTPTESARLQPDKPTDPSAYEYYLRGVDLYSRNQFPVAIKMLQKSAEIDPNYPLAWAYLGRAHNANASFQFGGREDYKEAQQAFEKALALQPTQIEANVYMANWLTDTGHVEQAMPLLKKALLTNPDHAEVHWELGYAYRFAGMLRESVAECEHARELDPGVKLNSSALNAYLYLGEYERFAQKLPNSDAAFIIFYRGFVAYYEKKWGEAAKHFDRAFELDPTLLQAQVGKALSESIANQRDKALEILGATERKINERGVGDPEAMYKIAQAYAVLGDRRSAIRVLKLSIESGFFAYPYFDKDPLLANLRGESQFAAIMKTAQRRHERFKTTYF